MGAEDAAYAGNAIAEEIRRRAHEDPFPSVVHKSRSQFERLLDAARKIGPNALEVLVGQSERLAEGQAVYGDDFDNGRNWHQESIAESGDGVNYAMRAALESGSSLDLAIVHQHLASLYLARAQCERSSVAQAAE